MKNFTKILALVIALVMVVSVFAACGNKKDDGNKNDTPAGDNGNTDNGGTNNGDTDNGGTNNGGTNNGGTDNGGTNNGGNNGGEELPPVDEDTATVYPPTMSGCIMGIDYGWGNDEMTLDFEGSNIERVKVADLDEATAALLADPSAEKFTDRVLKLAGADTFLLPGFDKDSISKFFTAGYTATFTIEYYAKAGTMSVVVINGDTTREIVAADKFEEGVHTITFDYTAAEGDTAIAFVTTGEAEFYFGRLGVILYAGGPSYNQLAAGYTFNWAQLPVDGKDYGTVIQVKDITDETAKAAIIASGKTEDDYVATMTPGTERWYSLPMSDSHYVEGRKYTIEVTYYTANGGGGQWFLVLDGTSGNNGVKNGMFGTKGAVATSNCLWQVTGIDFAAIWYDAPKDLIILDLKITLDTTYDPHYKREDVHETTTDDLAGQYVFDFSEGNAPAVSPFYVDVDELSEELQAVLIAENGFGSNVLHISTKAFDFYDSIDSTFTVDTEYTVTARVYSAVDNFASGTQFCLLAMNSSRVQVGSHGSAVITPVEGVAGVYDVSWTITATDQVASMAFYGTPTAEIYIGKITITAGTYVAPPPLPEESTTVIKGADIAANFEALGGKNTYGTWGEGGSGIVVDTPEDVKAAMGDKIGDRAVKVDKGANAGSFIIGTTTYDNNLYNFEVLNNKTKYIITIELYVESFNNDSVNFIINGHTSDFIVYSGLVEGHNTVTLEYATSAAKTWNIGCHQGDFVGYIGDVTIELVHV